MKLRQCLEHNENTWSGYSTGIPVSANAISCAHLTAAEHLSDAHKDAAEAVASSHVEAANKIENGLKWTAGAYVFVHAVTAIGKWMGNAR